MNEIKRIIAEWRMMKRNYMTTTMDVQARSEAALKELDELKSSLHFTLYRRIPDLEQTARSLLFVIGEMQQGIHGKELDWHDRISKAYDTIGDVRDEVDIAEETIIAIDNDLLDADDGET